jgi:hypothetical protein
MPNVLSIFSPLGTVLTNIPADAVALLCEEDRQILQTTLEACLEAERVDAEVFRTRDAVRDAMQAYDIAHAEDEKHNTALSEGDARAAWLHASDPNMPKPKVKKLYMKSRSALVAAGELLDNLRIEHQRLLTKQKTITSPARGTAIGEWIKTQVRITPLEIQRAAAKAYTPNPEPPPVVHKFAIDSIGAAGKTRQRTPSNTTAMPRLGHKY